MLTYNLEKNRDTIELIFIGKADNDGNKVFQEALDKIIEIEPSKVNINFKDLNFINSLGLGKFIRFYKNYQNRVGDIIISNVNDDIYRILESIDMTRLVKK